MSPVDHHLSSATADQPTEPSTTGRVRPGLLGVAPILFTAAYVVRATAPTVDPTLLAIGAAMVIVVGALLCGHRWAGLAFLIFPIALLTTPATADLSFSLSATDSMLWRWHAVVSLLTAGLASVVALAVALQRQLDTRAALAVAGGGAVLGALLVAAVPVIAPTQVFGQDLTAAERDALPEVALLNYAYVPLDIEIEQGETYRAMLVNDSDLPHTLTIDEIDLDVRVPAGREAVVEIDTTTLPPGVIEFYCAVGDHRPLGMVGQVSVAG